MSKAVLAHSNPRHAAYPLSSAEPAAVAALVPLAQIQNLPQLEDLRMNKDELADFAADILSNGLDQDVVVRKLREGLFEIVDGKHRAAAHAQVGFDTVPAQVRDYSDQEAAIRTILANALRKDLTPLQEAVDWSNAIATGITQSQLAEKIGKSPATVSKRLGLLQVPKAIAELAGDLVPYELVPWFRPLAGRDELAEKVATSIVKAQRPVTEWNRNSYIVDSLGTGKNCLATAPLDATWVGKLVKIPHWELYSFVTPPYAKQIMALDHAIFGTKSKPDLVIVWDSAKAQELANQHAEDQLGARLKEAAKRDTTADKRRKQRMLEEEAMEGRTIQRATETIGTIRMPTADLQELLAHVFISECQGSYMIDGPTRLEALKALLGKHADVYDDVAWSSVRIDFQVSVLRELFERSPSAAWKYVSFAMYLEGRDVWETGAGLPLRDQVHKHFVGETRKQTEAHAKKVAGAGA